jgi:citrate synthase
MHHTYIHGELESQMACFRYDGKFNLNQAHPMAMVISTIASLSTFHPEVNKQLN